MKEDYNPPTTSSHSPKGERAPDLIKKLEAVKTPEIEISSHKVRLKRALLDWYYKEEKAGLFWVGFKKILIPLGSVAVVLFLALLINNLIFPQDTLAKAKKIALSDPRVQELVKQGAEIKDIKIAENRAYVLLTPKEISNGEGLKGEYEKKELKSALAQIELKKERVSKIETVEPQIIPLTREEEEKTRKIIMDSVSPASPAENIPAAESKTISVEKIEPLPTYNLKLVKKDGEFEVLPEKTENEKVRVIYKIDGEKKEDEVNLTNEKIEKSKILEIEDSEKK